MHRDPVDLRMGINGLSILVEQAMHLNPMIVFAQNASIL
ncbi:IS66 family insertion sequence element accessory protein TnpB [Burkholderia pseudomallei]